MHEKRQWDEKNNKLGCYKVSENKVKHHFLAFLSVLDFKKNVSWSQNIKTWIELKKVWVHSLCLCVHVCAHALLEDFTLLKVRSTRREQTALCTRWKNLLSHTHSPTHKHPPFPRSTQSDRWAWKFVCFINCVNPNIYLPLRPSHLLNKDEGSFTAHSDYKDSEIILAFQSSYGDQALGCNNKKQFWQYIWCNMCSGVVNKTSQNYHSCHDPQNSF